MARKLALMLDGVETEAEVEDTAAGPRVRIGDRWHAVDLEPAGRHGLYSLLVDGRSYEIYARRRPGGWDVLVGSRAFSVDSGYARPRAARGAAPEPEGAWVLRSPLAGIVVETQARVGDTVAAGQVLLVVESMKMNNELRAARAGTITDLYVQSGERVERGAPLVRVE